MWYRPIRGKGAIIEAPAKRYRISIRLWSRSGNLADRKSFFPAGRRRDSDSPRQGRLRFAPAVDQRRAILDSCDRQCCSAQFFVWHRPAAPDGTACQARNAAKITILRIFQPPVHETSPPLTASKLDSASPTRDDYCRTQKTLTLRRQDYSDVD